MKNFILNPIYVQFGISGYEISYAACSRTVTVIDRGVAVDRLTSVISIGPKS